MPPPASSGDSAAKPWHTFTAGAVSGLVSECFTYPVSTAKARLQVQRVVAGQTPLYTSTFQTLSSIVQREGWRKLYSGYMSVLICTTPARACYFTGFEFSKRNLSRAMGCSDTHPVVSFISGQFAQLSGSLIFVPQDVLKERMQVQVDPIKSSKTAAAAGAAGAPAAASASTSHGPRFTGSVDAFRHIVREEGVRGLYRGYVAHQIVWAPYNGIYFTAYETCKKWFAAAIAKPAAGTTAATAAIAKPASSALQLPDYAYPLCAAASGAFAATVTYPMDLIKTRLQTQGSSGQYKSSYDCFQQIVKAGGPRAMFVGLPARILFLSPNHAITMTVYEKLSKWIKQF